MNSQRAEMRTTLRADDIGGILQQADQYLLETLPVDVDQQAPGIRRQSSRWLVSGCG